MKAKEDSKTDTNVPLISENLQEKSNLIDSAIKNITWQMDADRKAKPLKQLQGHMWSYAYKNGTVKGQ